MGIIRKGMSVSTLGMVSYRTPNQQIARNTRIMKRHARIQTLTGGHQSYKQHQIVEAPVMQRPVYQQPMYQQPAYQQPQLPPPGYYRTPAGHMQYWDGTRWTSTPLPETPA